VFGELTSKAAMWEEIARAGLPEIIEAWAADNIEKLLKSAK
jgi:hypothetical protein